MSKRSQKVMEGKHVQKPGSNRKGMKHVKPSITLEKVLEMADAQRKDPREYYLGLREYLDFWYENGAELFDKAVEIMNSPLAKALL